MKHNDQQYGAPEVIYKGTAAEIAALASPVTGMTAFATDTGALLVYTGSEWKAAGNHQHPGGDITSAVANANAVPWSGVTGKPFPFGRIRTRRAGHLRQHTG